MTLPTVSESWFDPLPLEAYARLVEESSANVPDECPVSEVIGKPQLDVRCGPVLRLLGTLENGSSNYRATVLVVTHDDHSDYQTAPNISYLIGPAHETSLHQDQQLESSIQTGTFPVTKFHAEQKHTFWRFEVELQLAAHEQKVKYFLNDHASVSYQFFVPAADQSMNVVSHSCNGFSLSTDTSTFKGSLWYDVLAKHQQHPYHVMLGGGDQIYSDAIKNASEDFNKWLKHKHLHSRTPLTKEMVATFEEFYMHHYLKWFGKGFWVGTRGKTLQSAFPIAMQQIPSINLFDDHDIIDGFGSYNDRTMNQPPFKGVGNSAYKYYMLFQQHTLVGEPSYTAEKSWILGAKPGPYINEKSHSIYSRLGREIAFLGFDCRTERKQDQIITRDSYRLIFERAQSEVTASNGEIKHLLVALGVPIAYPRLVWLETILTSRALAPIKYLARKGIFMPGLVNEFDGNIEVLDDLDDHWCAKHHKRERNRLVAQLTDFGAKNSVRITILSGDVHLCCIGRFKSKRHHIHKKEETHELEAHPERDPRLMFNVISSAICNTPPPDGMSKLLHARNKLHHFDRHTAEDCVPLFTRDVDGSERDNYHFLNKRNWCDLIPIRQSAKFASEASEHAPGELLLPGPADYTKAKPKDDTFDRYPAEPQALVVTLHVEKDSMNVDSKTSDYELLVPSLQTQSSLDHDGLKV